MTTELSERVRAADDDGNAIQTEVSGLSTLGSTLSGPEHQRVRLPFIKKLKKAGWHEDQIQWQPEWRVPKAPNEASKRESGLSFRGWPVDLVLFDDEKNSGSWEHIVVLCEFKAPTIDQGISQLEIYLNREPRARMGYWTNGNEDVRVYRLADGTFQHLRNRGIPLPSEGFERPSKEPLKHPDLVIPDKKTLRAVFQRLLDVIVARDSISTRSEAQLNEICNILLVKLESDTVGQYSPDQPLSFQLSATEAQSARAIREQFVNLRARRPGIFSDDPNSTLRLDDHSIHQAVYELSTFDLLSVQPEAISSGFQIFRRANLKAGEGQYYTPERVIQASTKMMDIHPSDRVIDPACGTGGFLTEAYLHILSGAKGVHGEAHARTWAHHSLFGVDKDEINAKLSRAILMSLGDGSVNVHVGDSLREHRWEKDYPHLRQTLVPGSFTVVITNPPFGQNLKVSRGDAARNKYTIAQKGLGEDAPYHDMELGLVFVERAYRLLSPGGRLGIVLPETYFFSSSYSWFPEWLKTRFILRGVLNIPMEAFQGFCRAKTNLYMFERRT